MVIYQSFYNIDAVNSVLVKKEIPSDFNQFVTDYIEYALNNQNVKSYHPINENTTVLHCITEIVNFSLHKDELNEQQNLELESYAHAIADKLFREEQDVQGRIDATGKQVKKGSLFQAFVKSSFDEYMFIIAKVEHSEWYDGESLAKNYGFPSDKKSVWKSAVFTLIIDNDELSFDPIRIYTDNDAKYWANRFLELAEDRTDYSNTSKTLKSIDGVLIRNLKKKHPRDYYLLRHSLIQRLRVPHLVNFVDLINDLVDGYVPESPELDLALIKPSLLELPETNGFDMQFSSDPSAITKIKKLKLPLVSGIDISISEDTNYLDYIVAKENDNGRYLEIQCHNTDTFERFKRRYVVNT